MRASVLAIQGFAFRVCDKGIVYIEKFLLLGYTSFIRKEKDMELQLIKSDITFKIWAYILLLLLISPLPTIILSRGYINIVTDV